MRHFLNFQELIDLLISEEHRHGTSPSNENSNEITFYSDAGRGDGLEIKTNKMRKIMEIDMATLQIGGVSDVMVERK